MRERGVWRRDREMEDNNIHCYIVTMDNYKRFYQLSLLQTDKI